MQYIKNLDNDELWYFFLFYVVQWFWAHITDIGPLLLFYTVSKKTFHPVYSKCSLKYFFFVKFHDTEYFHAEQKTTTFIMNEKLMDLKLIMNFKRNWRGEHL